MRRMVRHLRIEDTMKNGNPLVKTSLDDYTLALFTLRPTGRAETRASLRRFVARDGKTFYASVQSHVHIAYQRTQRALLKMGEAIIKDREVLSADLFRSEDKNAPVKCNHDAIFGTNFLRLLDAVITDKADPNN